VRQQQALYGLVILYVNSLHVRVNMHCSSSFTYLNDHLHEAWNGPTICMHCAALGVPDRQVLLRQQISHQHAFQEVLTPLPYEASEGLADMFVDRAAA
jgi:hypothetical protein